jgi:hypothetical protein
MAWVRKAFLKSTVEGPRGPIGLPGVNAVANDTATAGYVNASTSDTFAALTALFNRKLGLDPRDYGAIGDGVADDTAALNACITAAGDLGSVRLTPGAIYYITATLVLMASTELRGGGAKATEIRASTDITMISASGGQGQAITNLTVRNTTAGARTTYDIDFTSPTKPVIKDVEVNLPNGSAGGGGVRFRKDAAVAGNSFMPQLNRVWIRNGHLVIDGVTDGHVVDSYIWAPYTGARAAVDMSNIANGWSFAAVDVVPTTGDGAGYRMQQTWGTKITGGYIDGSYESIMTGYGIRMIDCGQMNISGTAFYNLGRSGIRLDNSHGNTVSSCGFERGNKQGNFYPDIDLYGSNYNTFTTLGHSMRIARANPGGIYREDTSSVGNFFDSSAINTDGTNNYGTPYFVGNAGTQGKNMRPASLWQRPSGVPTFIVPPASLLAIGAVSAAWSVAQRAQFHRFSLADGAVYRYANLRVDVAAGNVIAAVVRMDGLNFTRAMTSASTAAVAGTMSIDMTAAYLPPGEYALALWSDNATVQIGVSSSEMVRSSRLAGEMSSLTAGIPASGALTSWGSARAITGLTLTA